MMVARLRDAREIPDMTASVPERPRGREDVVFRRLDEEWVLYDPQTNQLHALNLSAALVWEHCTGELTVPEIADRVAAAFATDDRQQVLQDVKAAVARLAGDGLFV